MKWLPRRLSHTEQATLEDHLEELRWRIVAMLGALALGAIVAYVVRADILGWLNQPLPLDHKRVVTFGVAEPFTVTLTVSVYAGFLLALLVILWQAWAFFAPAVDPKSERRALGLASFATALGAGQAMRVLVRGVGRETMEARS